MTPEEILEYNKILAKFLGIDVEEFGYPHWEHKSLGIIDKEGDFKLDYDDTTVTFDASMNWNVLSQLTTKLTDNNNNNALPEIWDYFKNNKPQLAFKVLAEFIKENKL
jgi:hypothetical protein